MIISGTEKIAAFSIAKLVLSNFRNYNNLSLELNNSPVVISGPNGSGKTNILEAISFLSPGRGLRNIKLDEADRKLVLNNSTATKIEPWAVAAWLQSGANSAHIGTGRDVSSLANKRIIKIDGNVIRGQGELAGAFSVMWLTPQMDGIFLATASERRKFLDRLVYNFNPEHASLVYSYEYCMRERAKLLQDNGDKSWLAVLEAKMAEKAVAIAIARNDAVSIIQAAIYNAPSAFPKADLKIEGMVESLVLSSPALEVEELLKRQMQGSRANDTRCGRTLIGTHRSDLQVTEISKNMPARLCSTGEQKALLLAIILAEARAKAMWKNNIPVLLLDEVVAHLDIDRRNALFDEFIAMNAQVWMTGTDVSLFTDLKGKAQFFTVTDNKVLLCGNSMAA